MSMTFNAAGGGAGLNFSIVCDSVEPTPRENMIWVNTGKRLNGYVFASSAPESPLDGMVWILTSTTSTVAFNAAKRGVLMVYPLMCKQRINGAWTDVIAKSYINNGWRDWITYLYSPGNAHEELTGGWEGVAHRRVDSVDGWGVSGAKPKVTIPQGAEPMEVKLEATYPNNYSGSARTVNKIDLTNFDQIIFNLTFSGGTIYVYVTQSDTSYSAVKQLPVTGGTNNPVALNVSDLSGEFYVGINLLAASGTQTVTVTQITVE